MFSVNFNSVAADFGLSLIAGACKYLIARRSPLDVPVEEFIVRADFDDFEAFSDEIRRELPKLFKAAVAVKDGTDVLCGVVSGDAEIVCHSCSSCLVVSFESVLRYKTLQRIDPFFIERSDHIR